MSRQRFIYPEIWRSEQFLSLSIEARLLFIGIFSTSDDYGRHKASALSLKAEVFPADACTSEQITAWRSEIAERGMIRLYVDDGGSEILDIPSWAKFQKPRHVSDSRMPEYPGAGELTTAPADPRRTPGEPLADDGEARADDGSGVVWCGEEKSGVDVRPGAPEGQRAEAVTTTDLSASAAKSDSGDAEAALPTGGGTDAPTMDGTHDNGAFEKADDPETASRIWTIAKNEFDVWNGYDPAERLKATAEACGKMLTHDGRVRVLAAIFDAITATKVEPEKRWAAFRKKLKGRGGGSPDGRRWAKGITG